MYFRIKEARKGAKLTQKELSEKLGIKISTLSGYEIGAHDPKSNTLSEIAQICGVTVDFLLGIDGRTYEEIRASLGSNSPAAQKLRAIGEQLAPHTTTDTTRIELMELYERLNSNGREALLKYARFLNTDPDMKKAGASSDATA